jgi:hypothetical protein
VKGSGVENRKANVKECGEMGSEARWAVERGWWVLIKNTKEVGKER